MIIKKVKQVEPPWVNIVDQVVTRGEVKPSSDYLPKLYYCLSFIVTENLGTFYPWKEHQMLALFRFWQFYLTEQIRNGGTRNANSAVKPVIRVVTIKSQYRLIQLLLFYYLLHLWKQGIKFCSVLVFCHQSWLQNASLPTQKGVKNIRDFSSVRYWGYIDTILLKKTKLCCNVVPVKSTGICNATPYLPKLLVIWLQFNIAALNSLHHVTLILLN